MEIHRVWFSFLVQEHEHQSFFFLLARPHGVWSFKSRTADLVEAPVFKQQSGSVGGGGDTERWSPQASTPEVQSPRALIYFHQLIKGILCFLPTGSTGGVNLALQGPCQFRRKYLWPHLYELKLFTICAPKQRVCVPVCMCVQAHRRVSSKDTMVRFGYGAENWNRNNLGRVSIDPQQSCICCLF